MRPVQNLGDLIVLDDLDRPAVIDTGKDPHRLVSYRELDRMADAVARGLGHCNFSRGSKIAIVAPNSVKYLATYFGILRAGFVAVLLNHKLPSERLLQSIEYSETKMLFGKPSATIRQRANLPVIEFDSEFDSFLDYGEFDPMIPSYDEPAIMLFTSGSTGDSKAALVSHASHGLAVIQKRSALTKRLRQLDRSIKFVGQPLFHMNGLTNAEATFDGKSTLIISSHFDPVTYLKTIAHYRVTVVAAVPSMLALAFRETALIKTLDLSSVDSVILGSSPVPEKLFAEIRRQFPNVRRITNGYGSTEAGPGLFGRHPTGITRPEKSVGYPVEGNSYRIVDGVLQVRTPTLMSEYYKNPQQTRRSMTADGFYITGDLFEIDGNGFYYCLGRKDEMLICGGEKIYPVAIERVLEKFAKIAAAAVVGAPDASKGSKPYAFVTLKPGAVSSEDEIKRFAREYLATFESPRSIWNLRELPVNSMGKVDKAQLTAFARQLVRGQRPPTDLLLEF